LKIYFSYIDLDNLNKIRKLINVFSSNIVYLFTPDNTMFTGGAGEQVFRGRSAHHIPLPGVKLRQDGLSFTVRFRDVVNTMPLGAINLKKYILEE